jgi:hypothetical protein
MRDFRAGAQRNHSMNGWDIFIYRQVPTATGGHTEVATNITFETAQAGDMWPRPLTLANETTQMLFDELWAAGMRPSREESSTGAVVAQAAHIISLQGVTDRLFGILERIQTAEE